MTDTLDSSCYLGGFVHTAVVSEVLLLHLHVIYSLLLGSVLQPGDGPTDPLQELRAERTVHEQVVFLPTRRWWRFPCCSTHVTGQLLVVLHHLLVLLVHSQNFADPICGRLSLLGQRAVTIVTGGNQPVVSALKASP